MTTLIHTIKHVIRGGALVAVIWVATCFQVTATASEPIKIRMGWQPAAQVLFYIAREDKLFEKAGLDPEYIRFNAGPPMFSALRSGDIDIAYLGAPPAMIAISQGIPAKIFYTEDDVSGGESLVVRKNAGISSLSDLKGKTIGVWRGTSAEFGLRTAISHAGLTDTDVKMLDLDVTVILPAFEKEEVDGIYVWDPWALRLERAGGKQLFTDADVGIHMPIVWLGRDAWLENPEGGSRFIKALNMARDVLNSDKDRVAAITAKVLDTDVEFAAQLIERDYYPTIQSQLDPNDPLSIHPDAVAKNQGLAAELTSIAKFLHGKGRIPNVPNIAEAIDPRPIQGAIAK